MTKYRSSRIICLNVNVNDVLAISMEGIKVTEEDPICLDEFYFWHETTLVSKWAAHYSQFRKPTLGSDN